MSQIVDLKVNKSLLNPNFDGYKLSLQPFPISQKTLDVKVSRSLPTSSAQNSLLHSQVLSLHNHLTGDSSSEDDFVYFVDAAYNINRASISDYGNNSSQLHFTSSASFQEPSHTQLPLNPSIKICDNYISLASDGCGTLKIFDCSSSSSWKELFVDVLAEVGGNFVIRDAKCSKAADSNLRQVDSVLMSIRAENEEHRSVLHWLQFAEQTDSHWIQVSFRELQVKGAIHYCCLERAGNGLYVASDKTVKFMLDSEADIKDKAVETEKAFTWSQDSSSVTIKLTCPISARTNTFKAQCVGQLLSIGNDNCSILCGELYSRIDATNIQWSFSGKEVVVTLIKESGDIMWPELISGNDNGEFVANQHQADAVHERLGHLTSENEVAIESGLLYNSEQTEECDFEDDKQCVLDRIEAGPVHGRTHRVLLNSHKILLTVNLAGDDFEAVPAIGLRHDVDACIWQPSKRQLNQWSLKHEATLYAFAYIEASKQQRKFTVCAPDLSFVAVCEANRHVFVYQQTRRVESGELRDRTTGRRVQNVAQQNVITLAGDEILGAYAANRTLFLLTIDTLLAIRIT